MNTSHTQAQTEQLTPALTPDFKHRLCYNGDDFAEATPDGLVSAIEMIVERAIGVLTLVRGEFTGEDRGRTCDSAIFYSLESVEKDLMDVMSLSREFVVKHQAGHESTGGDA